MNSKVCQSVSLKPQFEYLVEKADEYASDEQRKIFESYIAPVKSRNLKVRMPATLQPDQTASINKSDSDEQQKSEGKNNLLLFRNSSLPSIKIQSPQRIIEQFTQNMESSQQSIAQSS